MPIDTVDLQALLNEIFPHQSPGEHFTIQCPEKYKDTTIRQIFFTGCSHSRQVFSIDLDGQLANFFFYDKTLRISVTVVDNSIVITIPVLHAGREFTYRKRISSPIPREI